MTDNTNANYDKSAADLEFSGSQDEDKTANRGWAAGFIILLSGLIVACLIIFYKPAVDYFIIKNANPAMVSLAEQAGMSKEGELAFLRAKPRFANDAQMRSDCADNAAANNNNGFIEQGCYIPDAQNHSTGKIFIRQMPANLYDQEIVTASYEMLHSIYFGASNSSLIMAIENNYNAVHDQALDMQVINFAKTEPGYRDLELFSLLGTEYDKLSPSLESFYKPYFSNRNLTVSSYNRVISTFQNDQKQLGQLDKLIASYDSSANTAYADSIAWAKAGNSYEDSYDYNIYKTYIDRENLTINQYNQLSQIYNTLVTEYNGSQPVNLMQSITKQNSK